MKVLITGSKGMLGSDIAEVLSPECEVVGIDKETDITEKEKIIKAIIRVNPDLIIHTAAFTDVDGCERNKQRAFSVNSIGTENVALAAKKLNVPILYISTDYVFDGEKSSPYIETDEPHPLNIYGKSKLRGEEYVKKLVPNYFIIRTAGLFGENGENFVKTILKRAREEKNVPVVTDQIFSPTWTRELSNEIKRLIETKNYGIYHLSNNGECSWYRFAEEILNLAQIKDVKLIPITSEELKRPAKRPKYSVLSNRHLTSTIGDKMFPWPDALKQYLKNARISNQIRKSRKAI